MKYFKVEELFNFQPKSKIKAGDGKKEGKYPFYTSSPNLSKFFNDALHNRDALIFGTGGVPSIHFAEQDFSTSTDCLVLKKKNDDFLTKYVYYFLKGNIHILEKGFKGVGLKHISKKYIQLIEIPLPDIETQKQLISIFDKANTLIKLREESFALLDELLVSSFIDMFGDPVLNNKELDVVRLKDLGIWKSGGTPLRSINSYFEGNIPWFSSGELNNMFIYESKEKITKLAIEKTSAKHIESGSLLIGMYDTAALKSSITKVNASCNQAIAFAKLNEKICIPTYVYFAIQIGREFHLSKRRGVRQKNLNLAMIKALEIPLAKLDRQIIFSNIVTKVEEQKDIIKESLIEANNLFHSLSQDAFSGKLNLKDDKVQIQEAVDNVKWLGSQLGEITSNKPVQNLMKSINTFNQRPKAFDNIINLQKTLISNHLPALETIKKLQQTLTQNNIPDLRHLNSLDKFNWVQNNPILKQITNNEPFGLRSIDAFLIEKKQKELKEELRKENDPVLKFINQEQIGKLTLNNYKVNVPKAIYTYCGTKEFEIGDVVEALETNEGLSKINKTQLKKDLFQVFREFIQAKFYGLFAFNDMRKEMKRSLFNPSFKLLQEFIETELKSKNGLTQEYIAELHEDPSDPYYNGKSNLERNRMFQLKGSRVYLRYKIETNED